VLSNDEEVCFTRFPTINAGAPDTNGLKLYLSKIASVVFPLSVLITVSLMRGLDNMMFSVIISFVVHIVLSSVGGRVKHIISKGVSNGE